MGTAGSLASCISWPPWPSAPSVASVPCPSCTSAWLWCCRRRALTREGSKRPVVKRQGALLEDAGLVDTNIYGWGAAFVVRENNPLRVCWNGVIAFLLLWTGSVFPFKLCFVDFRIPSSIDHDPGPGWDTVEWFIDALFWLDLVLIFFFSYRDEQQRQVFSLPKIARRYFRTTFAVNLIACMPAEVGNWVGPLFGKATGVAPLVRLIRLIRLAKLVSFVAESQLWRYVQNMRGVQMVNFTVGLLSIVHLASCLWYLCAAMHIDPQISWVGRRMVYDNDGNPISLIEKGPFEQWAHSMYFVLTVFISVGFGDIAAVTLGEVVFVCAVEILGAAVHSIIVSKMIHTVTNVDQENLEINRKRELVLRFAHHVQLNDETGNDLGRWVTKSKAVLGGYDQDEMRKMLMVSLSDAVMEKLHGVLFKGKLVQNRLVSVCSASISRLPPRFPLLVALSVHILVFQTSDMVYYWSDHAWNVFLVLDGSFAYVARPHAAGGICEVPCGPRQQAPQWNSEDRGMEFQKKLSMVSSNSFPTDRKTETQPNNTLFPYMLFGARSYFGEFEMFFLRTRVSSVRCEALGTVLVLSKVDFMRLMDEFPDFAEVWKSRTMTREGHRKASLRKLKRGYPLHHFAAGTIQMHWRKRHPDQQLRRSSFQSMDTMNFLRAAREGSPNRTSIHSIGSETESPPHCGDAPDLRPLVEELDLLKAEVRTSRQEVRQNLLALWETLGLKPAREPGSPGGAGSPSDRARMCQAAV